MREYVNVFSKAVREPPPYSSCQLGEHVWGHIEEWAIHEDLSDGSPFLCVPSALLMCRYHSFGGLTPNDRMESPSK